MTLAEQIQDHVNQLAPVKQSELLDFVIFLQKQVVTSQPNRWSSISAILPLVNGTAKLTC
jgi:hypothetical protein